MSLKNRMFGALTAALLTLPVLGLAASAQAMSPLEVTVSNLQVSEDACNFWVEANFTGWVDGLETDDTLYAGEPVYYSVMPGKVYQVTVTSSAGSASAEANCTADLDGDSDQVDDAVDTCPATPVGALVDRHGCSAVQAGKFPTSSVQLRYACGVGLQSSTVTVTPTLVKGEWAMVLSDTSWVTTRSADRSNDRQHGCWSVKTIAPQFIAPLDGRPDVPPKLSRAWYA